MHRCTYSDRLEIKNNQITYIVNAQAIKDNNKADVYKENEKGQILSRYLYFCYGIGNYFVEFPHYEYNTYYRKKHISTDTHYYKTPKRCNIGCYGEFTQKDREVILSKYPDFKYTMDKLIKNKKYVYVRYIFDLLKIWKEHKDCEYLINEKLFYLAINKRYYKLSKQRKKQVLSFYLKNKNSNFCYSFNDVLIMTKYKLSIEEYKIYENFKYKYSKCYDKKNRTYKDFLYIQNIKNKSKTNDDVALLYYDYLYMLENNHLKHDIKDKYWRFPNSYEKLVKNHNKLMAEENEYKEFMRIEQMKQAEQIKIEREKRELLKYENYIKIAQKYSDFASIIDGFYIYVPQDYTEWKQQAEVLNQCIISCNYVDKVINKTSVLVFIQKDNKPIATIEIGKNNEIIQFYCDEHDRNNCLPSDKLKETFNKWLENKLFFETKNKNVA